MSITPKRLLTQLDTRDGHVCCWHGDHCPGETLSPQHRGNRGMGGRKSGHAIENLVWLCSYMNGLIESDASVAAMATRRGIKISSHANPVNIPVTYSDGRMWFLLADGSRTELTEPPF